MGQSAKRSFIGVVRTSGSLASVRVDAEDELSATKSLQDRYGTENILEVRGEDGEDSEVMSQAEADIRKSVMIRLPAAWFAFAKWVLRGSVRK